MRRREVTVTPQGDRVPLQPTQGEQRQGNRGRLPTSIHIEKFKQTIHRIGGPRRSQPSPRSCIARREGRREEEEGEESL